MRLAYARPAQLRTPTVKTLIIKLNAMGDVVRTSALLHVLAGEISWITHPGNVELLKDLAVPVKAFSWDDRTTLLSGHYDLLLNLEDESEVAAFASKIRHDRLFGALLDPRSGLMSYSDDARAWFDMSLISRHGRAKADRLKSLNRHTYQELIFEGLGHSFNGERYVLPPANSTALTGDVALAPVAGPVWPMKGWAFYEPLRARLEKRGLTVNELPRRASLLEHIGDIRNHRCLVSGDSLPMHIALGTGTRCVTLFNCTSPWEIHDYGLQTKLISPLLGEFFYQRGLDPRATTAITLDDVEAAVMASLR
jgi:heptosyltransferase II